MQISRLRYILSQGAKEGLVDSSLDWPGVHCAKALVHGKSDSGTWFDRTKQRTLENQRRKPSRKDIDTDYEVVLSPLPCWGDCSKEEFQHRIAEMVQDIEAETKARHREKGTRSMGVRKILRTNPLHTPEKISWSTAHPIHVWCRKLRKLYFEAYQTFLISYRQVSELLRAGIKT